MIANKLKYFVELSFYISRKSAISDHVRHKIHEIVQNKRVDMVETIGCWKRSVYLTSYDLDKYIGLMEKECEEKRVWFPVMSFMTLA